MMDANQVWEVDEAIANMRRLAEFTGKTKPSAEW